MKKMVTKPVKKAANCSNLEVMCQTTRNDPGLGRRRMTITDQARVIRDYMAFRAGREPTADILQRAQRLADKTCLQGAQKI
jgi:hypothetical protein